MFKAHRLLYHSTLSSRVIKKKKKCTDMNLVVTLRGRQVQQAAPPPHTLDHIPLHPQVFALVTSLSCSLFPPPYHPLDPHTHLHRTPQTTRPIGFNGFGKHRPGAGYEPCRGPQRTPGASRCVNRSPQHSSPLGSYSIAFGAPKYTSQTLHYHYYGQTV